MFQGVPTIDAGNGARSVAIGDLDGDGIPDLAVAIEFGDDVSVLLGNGNGTFHSQQDFGAGDGPSSVSIGDFDGDGTPDLAVVNEDSDDMSVLLGNGDGTFQNEQRFGAGVRPFSLAVGDLDGDGALDLVLANTNSDDVSVLLGNGNGTFQIEQRFGAGDRPEAVAIGDLNSDGVPDLVAANAFSDDASILIGNGDGTFQNEQRSGAGDRPGSVAISDLDGDGTLDLAIANFQSDDLSVLLGNGDGTFQPEERFVSGDGPSSLLIEDLDGDGAPDLAVANLLSDEVSVLLGNGNGTFRDEQRFGYGDRPRSVAIGDLDGDGAPDLVTANEVGDDVSVLLGDGNGAFRTQQSYATGDGPQFVAIGDLDGNGIADFAVTNEDSDDVSVLLGNGDGTFQPEQRFGVGDFPQSVAIGDLDGDGALDLAVANRGNQGGVDDDVSILLGNGDGTFQPEQRFATGVGPQSIAIDDFDGDGVLDLATANSGIDDDVSILLGNGDGSFQNDIRFGAGLDPFSIAIGDLNGDGNSDLAVANIGDADVSVLLGNGDGTFLTEQRYDAGVLPGSIAIGDLDGDGALDLALANIVSDDVSVLLGNGDGTFQNEERFDADNGARSVAIGDLNRDGIPDLVVANQSSDNVGLFLGNGDGMFQTPQFFDARDEPRSVAIADLDGDGVPDLAVANADSNDVSVLFNATLATTFWSGNSGQIFTDSINWAGAAPSINAPNFAVFDATAVPGGFDPVENALLPADVSIRGLAQSNQEVQLNFFGNDLILLGDASSSDGPLGLELGTEQCGGMNAFPSVPPTFRLDNGSLSPSTLMTPRATIGRDGPAILEINGGNGMARLDVVEDLIVGDVGDGTIVLRTSDAELTYGTSVDDTDSLIIGDRATGLVDVTNGASVSATAGLGRFFLGRAPGSEGRIRINGADSVWQHLVLGADDLTVGENGRGAVEITDGGVFDTQFGTITLARSTGSSAEVTIRGPGSRWFDPIAELIVGQAGEATVTVADGGVLNIFSGITNDSRGVIRGDGSLSEVVNLGEIVVGSIDSVRGNVPRTLTVNGDYDQFDDPLDPEISGRVRMDLFDTGGTVESDRLSITGEASLAGGLFIESAFAIDPADMSSVNVLDAASVTGRFDVAFLPGVTPDESGNGRFLRVEYPVPVRADDGTSRGTVSVNLVVDTLTGDINTDNAESFDVNGAPAAAAVGDLNGDGLIDLALAVPDEANPTTALGSAIVLFNAGSAAGVWQGFTGSVQIPVGVEPSAIDIGRADQLGGLDLAVANRADDTAMIIANDGLGTGGSFAVTQTIPVGDAPSSIVFGELDEDKWDSLAVANFGDDSLSVLANDGLGTPTSFSTDQVIPVGDGPIDVFFGELDEDKWDDIAVALQNDGMIAYLDNTFPPGTFDPPVILAADAGVLDLRGADLNGDGINELITANPLSNTVSIILNNGNSTFEPVVNLPLDGAPRSIAVVDLDDDGDRDLAVIADDGMGANTIRVLRNDLTDGQLIFSEDDPIVTGTSPLFVLAGDVDSDGQGDLVTVNSSTGSRSASSQRGTNKQMAVSVVRQSAAALLCPGDCDGDSQVNFSDLVAMLGEFGTPGMNPGCDADESGTVDFGDLVTALGVFGGCE